MDDLLKKWDSVNGDSQPAALIEWECERGIVFRLGESMGGSWQSGDVIVFWADGEHTTLPDNYKIIESDLYELRSHNTNHKTENSVAPICERIEAERHEVCKGKGKCPICWPETMDPCECPVCENRSEVINESD